jgi:hypothetical protein
MSIYQNWVFDFLRITVMNLKRVLQFLKLKWWMVYIITRWFDHVAISPLSTMNACGYVPQATWFCRYLFGKNFFSNLLQHHASLSRSNSLSFSIPIPSPICIYKTFQFDLNMSPKSIVPCRYLKILL